MELKYSTFISEEKLGWYIFVNLECPCGKPYQRRKDRIKLDAICISCTRSKGASQHGMCKTPEYKAWGKMKERCNNSKCKSYHNYGGRGILVCDRWLHSFKNFLIDMGMRPSPKHSLDRINNNDNYFPENCKWSTATQQTNNQRKTVFFTYKGKTQSVSEWGREYNIEPFVLHGRINTGWPIEKALNAPVRLRKPNKKVA